LIHEHVKHHRSLRSLQIKELRRVHHHCTGDCWTDAVIDRIRWPKQR